MDIVFATGNSGKIKEIKKILKDLDADVYSLKDLNLSQEAAENGESFGENAFIKADEIYRKLKAAGKMNNVVVMADDSGLGIDCLYGAPGVHSARFMGHETDYGIKNAAILDIMSMVPEEKRGARFVCHICAIDEHGSRYDAEDEMEGVIAYEISGKGGFGYDPIFFLPELGRTSAELTEDEKNAVSHRGKALRNMRSILEKEGILRLR